MNRIVTMSRREIEAHAFGEESEAAICIAYPTGRLHRVVGVPVHHTRFSDCDECGAWSFPDNKDAKVAVPMTRGQAIDILDFVAKHAASIDTLYVACYGGVSRSRGVAAGLAVIYGLDDAEIYRGGQPNAWCKTLIVREARRRETPCPD